MKFLVRTNGKRQINSSYEQIPYELFIDTHNLPIDSFIQSLYYINNEDSFLMEDDIILCDNFYEQAQKSLMLFPSRIINYFLNPSVYVKTYETTNIQYNLCTFYPKGTSSKVADIMKTLHRVTDSKKNMYSLLEKLALEHLGIKVVLYRPCLVLHLDYDTYLFDKTYHNRRTPYFIDYIKKLNIEYENASGYSEELKNVMDNHFRILELQGIK